ncbi:(2Fe-2S)-binding protein [Sunxiuqinia elliptica]|uniref:Bacterioferritin-associated ferredoxin n=1 Tax=Sunxiuqinia elliptica TaxID=655355 RepID=A0A1I2JC55_9BACT|nr:(2Fe-2S)-binding protein [Sunxiuqinia elliptica]TDN98940.1 BFD-like [2Fe-2S] binding protein [Sunxiuqinia elliptica]TDO56381.1 BFD-like [2Fe-2S] binding protein [Sunxiuqinia elliptica]SFF52114.1 BFD-like [2Fe-2S] binding domain-containing protein [Sunxiuqinia elliptica]
MGDRLVCLCNMVSEKEIEAALKKGARSTEDIQYLTRAGTSCGKCLMTIDQLVEEYELKAVVDPQQKLDL